MDVLFFTDILLSFIALIYLLVACFEDIKKREIHDWLSFSLIAIALAVRAIVSLSIKKPFYFLYSLLALGIFYAVALLLYYAKAFGGGDAKFLIALSVVFATTPKFSLLQEPFLFTFVVNSIVLSFFYVLFFSFFLAVKNRKGFAVEFKKENRKGFLLKVSLFFLGLLFIILSFIFSPSFLIFSLVFFALPYLYFFVKAVENSCLIKKVKPSQLREGDWLVESVKIKGKIIRPSVHGLSEKEIGLLKKARKSVRIKEGIPFIPVYLISVIVSFFANLLELFLGQPLF